MRYVNSAIRCQALVTAMHGAITKECTLTGLILQLIRIIWPQVGKTCIAKNPEHMIIRMHVKQNNKRYLTFKRCGRKSINQKHDN